MSELKTCFVICAIGLPGSSERKHADIVLNYLIKPTVEQAGYRVKRADEATSAGMITVDTINDIFDSDLVIADLTFHNPNVFYELGLRHSTKRPTIHIASHDTSLPFDNADHRAVFYEIADWNSHNACRASLTQHVEAIGTGFVTNPVSVAQAHKNDARLTREFEILKNHVAVLEERVGEITQEPAPGHITRDAFKEITRRRQKNIMEIVRSIRQRMDQPHVKFPENRPHASDIIQRLNIIERHLDVNAEERDVAPVLLQ
ncbi:MAG: hypothetical protein AAFZ01_02365 [Pseudomonadota bacterium]